MTDTVADLVVAISASVALSIVVKATIVLSLALLAVRLGRRARASLRHAILASAFGVMIVLPLFTMLVPGLAIPIVRLNATASPSTPPAVRVAPVGQPHAIVPPATSETTPRLSIASALVGAWAIGAVVFLAPLAIAVVRRRHLVRGGLSWTEGHTLVVELSLAVGLRRAIALLRHEDVDVPMTCGVARAAILLPIDAASWSEDDLRRALRHELEHIKRGDAAIQLVAELVVALYWFHPLVWIAARQLHLTAELACDDATVAGTDRAAYATQLVGLAQRLPPRATPLGLSMAKRSDLSTRVAAILNPEQPRGPLGYRAAIAIAGLATIGGVGGSSLRAVHAAGQSAAESPSFEVATLKLNVSGPGPFAIVPGPGRLRGTNIPAKFLIGAAFAEPGQGPLHLYRIIGGPGWLNTARFDLEAKAPEHVRSAYAGPPAVLFAMLRTLMLERFKMTVRLEQRELPVYALVRARADGTLGRQLVRRSDVECSALAAQVKNGGATTTATGRPLVGFKSGIDRISGGCTQLRFLIDALSWSPAVDRLVVDRTDLDGLFDYELVWTPDALQPNQLASPDGASVPATGGASMFTALGDQLGLRLEGSRGPVGVVVIDHAEMPQQE